MKKVVRIRKAAAALALAVSITAGAGSALEVQAGKTIMVTEQDQQNNRAYKGYVLTQEEKQAYWDMTMNYVNLVPKAVTVYNGTDYSAEFDPAIYYLNYPDLQTAIGADSAALLAHYVTSGKAEGRIANIVMTPWGNYAKDTVEANCYVDLMLNQDWAVRYVYWLNQERAARGLGQVTLNNYLGWKCAVAESNILLAGGNPIHHPDIVAMHGNWTGGPSKPAVESIWSIMAGPYDDSYKEPHKADLLNDSATEYGVALYYNPVNRSNGHNNDYILRQSDAELQVLYDRFMTDYTLGSTTPINQYGMGCTIVHN